jgi:hypothetical protein
MKEGNLQDLARFKCGKFTDLPLLCSVLSVCFGNEAGKRTAANAMLSSILYSYNTSARREYIYQN